MKTEQYIYRIDENDNIIYVSDNWNTFIDENFGDDSCKTPHIIGRSFWDFITDSETSHLYEIMVIKVREAGRSLTVPIRCDAPDLKRYIEITVSLLENNIVEFNSTITKTESREPLDILDKSIPRSDELIKICSYCKKINVNDSCWLHTEHAIEKLKLFEKKQLPKLTHGVCPTCYDEMMKTLSSIRISPANS
jgi:hypothetical protein